MPRFSNTIAAVEQLSTSIDRLIEKADTFVQKAPEIQRVVEERRESFDVLSDLHEKLQREENDFSKELDLQIQAVRLGAKDLEDFIQMWGDATIATSEGMKKVRELFEGADLGQYRQQIQDLIQDLNSGKAELGEVLTFLKENAADLAKGLIRTLDLFREGKASLEDVQRALDAARQAFPGVEGGALIDAINDAIAQGTL